LIEPESRYFTSFSLRLHYAVWGDEDKPPLILVHGKGDHARSWEFLAQAFAQRFCVYAPDLRGHGDSDWAAGGGYLMADYVADLSRLVRAIDRRPVAIIGHSLGGRIVPFFAAAFPECVQRVISIEGFGGVLAPGTTAQRLRRYAEEALKTELRHKRAYASVEEAALRMAEEHPDLSPEAVMHLTKHALRRQPDETLVWKYDPFVRMQPFYESGLEDSLDVWEAVRAPMLIIVGSAGWERMRESRRQMLTGRANARIELVAGAGHWLHISHSGEFLDLAERFLRQA
jgi:pimeloyl-ACP methyl ester carboxylesterase